MEQQHRSRKHTQKSRTKLDNHRRYSHLVGHIKETNPLSTEAAQKHSPHQLVRSERLKGISARHSLNDEDSYVRRWLAETKEDMKRDSGESRLPRGKPQHRDDDPNLQPTSQIFGHINIQDDTGLTGLRQNGKRRHASSSDSSLLESPRRSKAVLPKSRRKGGKEVNLDTEVVFSGPHKRRKDDSSDSEAPINSSTQLSSHKEIFQKRPRYKTRKDRYEPKREWKASGKGVGEKRVRSKREKKSDQKKAAKEAGRDFMHNFSSKSIAPHRLTIRPSHGLGLFKNGRASSPLKRRGLPDLAFSEMDFLQRPKYSQSTERESKVTSQLRQKEKRKASQAQEEISIFFKPPKRQLEDASGNDREPRSVLCVSDQQVHSWKKIATHNYRHSYDESELGLNDLPKNPFLGLCQPAPSNDSLCVPRGPPLVALNPEIIADSVSRLSEKATSYITWSESQFSPSRATHSKTQCHFDRLYTSPTPESVRKAIENSGIFNDTGIDLTKDLRRSREKFASKLNAGRHRQPSMEAQVAAGGHDISGITHASLVGTYSSKPPHFIGETSSQNHNQSLELYVKPEKSSRKQPRRRIGDASADAKPDTAESGTGKVMIEQYNRESEQHYRQDSGGPNKIPGEDLLIAEIMREVDGRPVTREQLARSARIKLPPTTLPITRVPDVGIGPESGAVEGLNEITSELPLMDAETNPPPITAPASGQDTTSEKRNQQAAVDPRSVQQCEPSGEYKLTADDNFTPETHHATAEVQIEKGNTQPVVGGVSGEQALEDHHSNPVEINSRGAENTSLPIMPPRVSSILRNFQPAFRTAHSLSSTGIESLYIRQIHRNTTGSPKFPHGEATRKEEMEGESPVLNHLDIPYGGEYDYNILAEMYDANAPYQIDRHTNMRDHDLDYVDLVDIDNFVADEAWRPMDQTTIEEIEEYLVSNSPGRVMHGLDNLVDAYNGHDLVPLYELWESGYDQIQYDSEEPRLFWQPHPRY